MHGCRGVGPEYFAPRSRHRDVVVPADRRIVLSPVTERVDSMTTGLKDPCHLRSSVPFMAMIPASPSRIPCSP
jgi:hypothetical protein